MTGKWRFSCKREPERFAQRVNVGAHVERRMFKLFGARERWGAHESIVGQRLWIGCGVKSFCQTEINYFHHRNSALAERAHSTSRGPSLIGFHHFGVVHI